MEMRTQPKDMVALTTLGLLSEQPCHPYEIQRLLKERHKSYAVGKTRTLYRAIEELEAAGYIEPIETSREGRRPERTVYRITPEGSEELENWLADLLSTPVDETPVFRVAVGLLGYITQERAEAALASRVVEPPRARRRPRRRRSGWLRTISAFRGSCCSSWSTRSPSPRPRSSGSDRSPRTCSPGALVWNEELIRAHFAAMHAADAERRNRHREHHVLARLRNAHPARPRKTVKSRKSRTARFQGDTN